jgi:hypothetical protein
VKSNVLVLEKEGSLNGHQAPDGGVVVLTQSIFRLKPEDT